MKHAIPLGTYHPGRSGLHRAPAGVKLVALVAFVVLLTVAADSPVVVAVAAGVVASGYGYARIPAALAVGQLLPAAYLIAFFGFFDLLVNGVASAALLVSGLLATVAAAVLVTLTTRVSHLLDAVEAGLRPGARIGLPVDRITLAIALTLRLIPRQAATVRDVLEARAARGVGFSLRAVGVPVLVRCIRRARALGEALAARGVGDD
ncbi:energy-coupling factor transporter transmembrane component T family protein [Corynebacterium uterequi]|uniref:ABC-type cobalt transport system, permease component CbiQ n=1 Tax=Corynebacterium uterequi TaxID=1072256 RepID=A0A0G3HDB6_9CORY|nr:energy-coupling factor transporter transmembrane protein EcfT [Corynebacterium uterequi]AKK11304.1 ABC-type cobalt transport system, permease component CbiQ [Corynebacterium uterequi]